MRIARRAELQKSWVLKVFDSVMSAGCLLDLEFEAEVYHFWRPGSPASGILIIAIKTFYVALIEVWESLS